MFETFCVIIVLIFAILINNKIVNILKTKASEKDAAEKSAALNAMDTKNTAAIAVFYQSAAKRADDAHAASRAARKAAEFEKYSAASLDAAEKAAKIAKTEKAAASVKDALASYNAAKEAAKAAAEAAKKKQQDNESCW